MGKSIENPIMKSHEFLDETIIATEESATRAAHGPRSHCNAYALEEP
jgi:hypothetical protein